MELLRGEPKILTTYGRSFLTEERSNIFNAVNYYSITSLTDYISQILKPVRFVLFLLLSLAWEDISAFTDSLKVFSACVNKQEGVSVCVCGRRMLRRRRANSSTTSWSRIHESKF